MWHLVWTHYMHITWNVSIWNRCYFLSLHLCLNSNYDRWTFLKKNLLDRFFSWGLLIMITKCGDLTMGTEGFWVPRTQSLLVWFLIKVPVNVIVIVLYVVLCCTLYCTWGQLNCTWGQCTVLEDSTLYLLYSNYWLIN